MASTPPPGQVRRGLLGLREEPVPPRRRLRLRLGPSVPPSSSSRFHDVTSSPPPRRIVRRIDVGVRPVDDVDMVCGEQTGGRRVREEGRAQEERPGARRVRCYCSPRQKQRRGPAGAAPRHATGQPGSLLSVLLLVWRAASLRARGAAVGVGRRCACAVARCAGVPLDRCAFVVAPTADRRQGWRFARARGLLTVPKEVFAPVHALRMEKWRVLLASVVQALDFVKAR